MLWRHRTAVGAGVTGLATMGQFRMPVFERLTSTVGFVLREGVLGLDGIMLNSLSSVWA